MEKPENCCPSASCLHVFEISWLASIVENLFTLTSRYLRIRSLIPLVSLLRQNEVHRSHLLPHHPGLRRSSGATATSTWPSRTRILIQIANASRHGYARLTPIISVWILNSYPWQSSMRILHVRESKLNPQPRRQHWKNQGWINSCALRTRVGWKRMQSCMGGGWKN